MNHQLSNHWRESTLGINHSHSWGLHYWWFTHVHITPKGNIQQSFSPALVSSALQFQDPSNKWWKLPPVGDHHLQPLPTTNLSKQLLSLQWVTKIVGSPYEYQNTSWLPLFCLSTYVKSNHSQSLICSSHYHHTSIAL